MILIADSGSTKTDWCVAEGGKVVMRIATQGINPFHQDEKTIISIINDELMTQLGDTKTGAIYFYGSGCRDEFVPLMQSAFSRFFPQASAIEVHGDLLGAARAVCGAGQGVACILGTGANSCLYDGKAIVCNTPPLGYILGDEGSGAVLGRLLVNSVFKRQLPDDICEAFVRETALTQADIIRRVYREPLANRFLASLAPFVHRHIDSRPLQTLVVGNFRNFFRRNILQYGRPELPVGCVGSIAFFFAEQLREAAEAEGLVIGNILRSPMDGLVEYHK